MKLQKDGAHNSICGDLDCPGLQLVSGSPIFPSDIISPVTEGNGARQTITIKVLKVFFSLNFVRVNGQNKIQL
jgi:hypothetical protein